MSTDGAAMLSPAQKAALALMLLLAAAGGLYAARWSYALSETALINRYATLYIEERQAAGQGQGKLTDCHAVPGRAPQIRLTVICEAEGRKWVYPIDQWGRHSAQAPEQNA